MATTALFRPGDRPLLHLGLLGLTVCTTFAAFYWMFGGGMEAPARLRESAMFAFSIIAILGSHEMGHYLMARHHKVDASLPYFIPLPPPLGFGTLGAVIRIRSRIPTLNALVDIGAAGPLVGLVVAMPILAYGLAHSRVVDFPAVSSAFPGQDSLFAAAAQLPEWLRHRWTGAPMPQGPAPAGLFHFGDPLLVKGLTRLILGPLPEGKDVIAHPMVTAGWFGMLVTMLNLVPLGQLDGGHVSHALFGRRAETVGKLMALGMLGLTIFWSWSWIVWLVVTTKLIGFKHPEVTEPEVPLSRGRKILSVLCLIAFVACFIPVPISQS